MVLLSKEKKGRLGLQAYLNGVHLYTAVLKDYKKEIKDKCTLVGKKQKGFLGKRKEEILGHGEITAGRPHIVRSALRRFQA